MGREIKFRVWDKRSKEIVDLTGYKIVSKNNVQLFYYDEDGDRATCTTWLENIEFMQYTGLKDKNGKEICEGDILEKGTMRFKIKWGESEPAFFAISNEKQCNVYSVYGLVMNGASIIGNIYEKPELLEGAK